MPNIIDEIIYRDARREDALEIATLYQLSGSGVADYLWSLLQPNYPDLSILEIGNKQYERINTDYSYQNCLIAELTGETVGMVHSYPVTEPLPQCDDPVLKPFCDFDTVSSLYISGIAVYPDHRDCGIGAGLMDQIKTRAKNLGLEQLSLIAFEQNSRAVRLYEHLGYRIMDRTPVTPHPLIQHTGDVVLMMAGV